MKRERKRVSMLTAITDSIPHFSLRWGMVCVFLSQPKNLVDVVSMVAMEWPEEEFGPDLVIECIADKHRIVDA